MKEKVNKYYLAGEMQHNPKLRYVGENQPIDLALPKGCAGIMFAFKYKKDARAYFGNDIHLIRIATTESKPS